MVWATQVFLHRRQRNLDARATRRFIDSDHRKRPFKNLHGRTNPRLTFFDPDGIDNRLISVRELRALFDPDSREGGVLVKRDAVDKTHSESAVTLIERLAYRHCGANTFDARNLLRMRDR